MTSKKAIHAHSYSFSKWISFSAKKQINTVCEAICLCGKVKNFIINLHAPDLIYELYRKTVEELTCTTCGYQSDNPEEAHVCIPHLKNRIEKLESDFESLKLEIINDTYSKCNCSHDQDY